MFALFQVVCSVIWGAIVIGGLLWLIWGLFKMCFPSIKPSKPNVRVEINITEEQTK